MRATERVIKEDHAQIRRALAVIEQMASLVREEGEGPLRGGDADDMVLFLQTFVDRCHNGREEGVLFPALLRDHSQVHYPLIRRVTLEHDRWRSLVTGLEEAVRSRRSRDFAFYAEKQVDALRDHIDKEELLVLSLAAGTLSEEEDQRVADDMGNFDRLWQPSLVSTVLRWLDEMEVRYTWRAHAPAY